MAADYHGGAHHLLGNEAHVHAKGKKEVMNTIP
jgi:hypothetical protein